MFILPTRASVMCFLFIAATLLVVPFNRDHAQAARGHEKVKVLYHVDGKDPEVAKYALALINKHIDAEGGPEKIDICS